MKKLLLFIMISFAVPAANAQSHKIFLNSKGEKSDSSKATSFIINTKVSDTIWVVKQYGMDDTIMLISTYKDENLTIPNGGFVAYQKNSMQGVKVISGNFNGIIDTLNYISLTGSFNNGARTGVWISRFPNGHTQFVNTYDNDELNGPYEAYDHDSNTVFIKGNYINNLRQGAWYMLDREANIFETDTYKDGEIISKDKTSSPYISSSPPVDFKQYVDSCIGNLIDIDLNEEVTIDFTITAEGKLINPQIITGTLGKKIDNKLLATLTGCPLWKPAYDKNLKKNVEDLAEVSIRSDRGNLLINYFDQTVLKGMKDNYYRFTH